MAVRICTRWDWCSSSLLAANTQTLTRLGASQDSVTRFLSRLKTIGVGATLPRIPDERLADNASAIVRYDWSLGELHTLTVRGDWRGQVQDATRISSNAVPTRAAISTRWVGASWRRSRRTCMA